VVTSTSTSEIPSPTESASGGLSSGAKGGIAGGVIGGVIILGCIVALLWYRRKPRNDPFLGDTSMRHTNVAAQSVISGNGGRLAHPDAERPGGRLGHETSPPMVSS
jgi:hypothetical protein